MPCSGLICRENPIASPLAAPVDNSVLDLTGAGGPVDARKARPPVGTHRYQAAADPGRANRIHPVAPLFGRFPRRPAIAAAATCASQPRAVSNRRDTDFHGPPSTRETRRNSNTKRTGFFTKCPLTRRKAHLGFSRREGMCVSVARPNGPGRSGCPCRPGPFRFFAPPQLVIALRSAQRRTAALARCRAAGVTGGQGPPGVVQRNLRAVVPARGQIFPRDFLPNATPLRS